MSDKRTSEVEPPTFLNRELSWLAFNARVLQEAADERVPLFERLTFLSIFSSNLDEFFRVRVASLRSLLRLKRKKLTKLDEDPVVLLREIHRVVHDLQERFGEIFRTLLLPELQKEGIFLVDETGLTNDQIDFAGAYFDRHVAQRIHPVVLGAGARAPFLENHAIYLIVELWPVEPIALGSAQPEYGLVEIPSPPLDRFIRLPADETRGVPVIFVDDVVRLALPRIFADRSVGHAYSVKLTRDAELYVEDEFTGDFVAAIRKALSKREQGLPSRFLYDRRASKELVEQARSWFDLAEEDLVVGGRYHNLDDLARFPRIGSDDLSWDPWPQLPHPELDDAVSILDTVGERDRLLHFPYQSYDTVIRFLREAADDPDVEEIWLTVYRVSNESAVLQALIDAADRGKTVHVFVEVKARFDEESNLRWAERMEAAGIRIIYSIEQLKVHAKIALVVRREGSGRRAYAYLSTGNFNESTARFYTDFGLLTADVRLTDEVEQVFHFLAGRDGDPVFEHLIVAPFGMRERLSALIGAEASAAGEGRPASIVAKMNSLEDRALMELLSEAEARGVDIRMIVRGICCMVPREGGARITSIIDRYLEHWRAWLFHAGGEDKLYLASADWMHRNLSRRVEVAFPLYDPLARDHVRTALELQLRDNTKARLIERDGLNRYVARAEGEDPVRAQAATRELLRSLVVDVSA